jgi:hypothetical protein
MSSAARAAAASHRHHIDPVVEIVAELLGHELREIAVRSAMTRTSRHLAGAAEP